MSDPRLCPECVEIVKRIPARAIEGIHRDERGIYHVSIVNKWYEKTGDVEK